MAHLPVNLAALRLGGGVAPASGVAPGVSLERDGACQDLVARESSAVCFSPIGQGQVPGRRYVLSLGC